MLSLKKLKKIIEQNFGPPYLPKGFVKVRETYVWEEGKLEKEPALSIHIGDRDVEIDKNGEHLGSGDNVGEGREWEIIKLVFPPASKATKFIKGKDKIAIEFSEG